MKKPLLIVSGINIGVILLLLPGILEDPDFGAVLGMTMLIAAVINGGLGLLLSLLGLAEKSMLRYGLALLAISGIYLLSGFTLCSQNKIPIN